MNYHVSLPTLQKGAAQPKASGGFNDCFYFIALTQQNLYYINTASNHAKITNNFFRQFIQIENHCLNRLQFAIGLKRIIHENFSHKS